MKTFSCREDALRWNCEKIKKKKKYHWKILFVTQQTREEKKMTRKACWFVFGLSSFVILYRGRHNESIFNSGSYVIALKCGLYLFKKRQTALIGKKVAHSSAICCFAFSLKFYVIFSINQSFSLSITGKACGLLWIWVAVEFFALDSMCACERGNRISFG